MAGPQSQGLRVVAKTATHIARETPGAAAGGFSFQRAFRPASFRGGTPGFPAAPLLSNAGSVLALQEPSVRCSVTNVFLALLASRRAKPASGGGSFRLSLGRLDETVRGKRRTDLVAIEAHSGLSGGEPVRQLLPKKRTAGLRKNQTSLRAGRRELVRLYEPLSNQGFYFTLKGVFINRPIHRVFNTSHDMLPVL